MVCCICDGADVVVDVRGIKEGNWVVEKDKVEEEIEEDDEDELELFSIMICFDTNLGMEN